MELNTSFNSSWSYTFKWKLAAGGTADLLLYTRRAEGLPDEDVVLKVLKNQDAGNISELLNEGQRLSELKHPNILSTLGYERISSNQRALVLEYVKGKNLREVIPKIRSQDRSYIASYILKNVARALLEAHKQKIIHGDISSRNILISEEGIIKLSDFGESRRQGVQSDCLSQRGSLDYLAPERWKGNETSKKADVFALGVLAYEVLTGDNPLRIETGRKVVLDRFLKSKPWRPFTNWTDFFSKTLTIDPLERGSCEELISLIPEFLGGQERLISNMKSKLVPFEPLSLKTSTLILKNKVLGGFIWGFLKPILIGVLLTNSVAIGVDHSFKEDRRRPSTLTVTSLPWGEVFIDGVSVGHTPILNLYLKGRFHRFLWRDSSGFEIRRAIIDYGNALFAYKILRSPGEPPSVIPLMNVHP